MATAGRILIMGKGAWLAETTYDQLDLVSHNGRAWLARKTCVGIEPSDATSEYWHDFLGIDIYSEDNPPTAEEVGALPSTGGTLSGPLVFLDADNALEFCLQFSNKIFQALVSDGTNYRELLFLHPSADSDLANALSFTECVDGALANYMIYGRHNKTTGTYAGNGDATSRTISTGGVGSLVLISSSNGMAILGLGGPIIKAADGATVSGLTASEALFANNGDIVLNTASNVLNANGVTYTWTVL